MPELPGQLPDEPWAAALTVQYRWPLPIGVTQWPRDEDGRPARRLELSEPLGPVPAWVTLTLAVGSRIVLASQALRAPH